MANFVELRHMSHHLKAARNFVAKREMLVTLSVVFLGCWLEERQMIARKKCTAIYIPPFPGRILTSEIDWCSCFALSRIDLWNSRQPNLAILLSGLRTVLWSEKNFRTKGNIWSFWARDMDEDFELRLRISAVYLRHFSQHMAFLCMFCVGIKNMIPSVFWSFVFS